MNDTFQQAKKSLKKINEINSEWVKFRVLLFCTSQYLCRIYIPYEGLYQIETSVTPAGKKAAARLKQASGRQRRANQQHSCSQDNSK
jgi:hypothetical protein